MLGKALSKQTASLVLIAFSGKFPNTTKKYWEHAHLQMTFTKTQGQTSPRHLKIYLTR